MPASEPKSIAVLSYLAPMRWATSPLRARMIEDMSVRKFGEKTQNDYIRHVSKTFSTPA